MDCLHRIARLQKAISEKACDAFLIEDPLNLFYFTGLSFSAGKLVIQGDNVALLVDSRYFEACQKKFPSFTFPAESLSLAHLLEEPLWREGKSLGFDSDKLAASAYFRLQKELTSKRALLAFPGILQELRAIKEEEEIVCLREAAALGSQGFDFLSALLKEGMTEREAACELEIFWKKRGGQGVAFEPIIAFGSHSSLPHWRANDASLLSTDPILIDIGVKYRDYCSDMTRVLLRAQRSPLLKRAYSVVREAQQKALELCREGVAIEELDKAARGCIERAGWGENFTHSLGHGVGLEIHEEPFLRNKSPYRERELKEGMVITIEPGVYLPGVGGIRLEDTIVIRQNGYENLTRRAV